MENSQTKSEEILDSQTKSQEILDQLQQKLQDDPTAEENQPFYEWDNPTIGDGGMW